MPPKISSLSSGFAPLISKHLVLPKILGWLRYTATKRIFVTVAITWGIFYVVQNAGTARNFVREGSAT